MQPTLNLILTPQQARWLWEELDHEDFPPRPPREQFLTELEKQLEDFFLHYPTHWLS